MISYKTQYISQKLAPNPLLINITCGGGYRMFSSFGSLIRVRYLEVPIRNTSEKSGPCRLLCRLWVTPASSSVEAEPRLWRPLREPGRYL